MKKRIIAIALALVLVIGGATIALANDAPEATNTGRGTIGFANATIEIFPPVDDDDIPDPRLPDPDGPNAWDVYNNLDLDFDGGHRLGTTTMAYPSTNARFTGGRAAGFAMETDAFATTVKVHLSNFTTYDDADPTHIPQVGLQGARLVLTNESLFYCERDAVCSAAAFCQCDRDDAADAATNLVGAVSPIIQTQGPAQTVLQVAEQGVFAGNWTGVLTVDGTTATANEYEATMTWLAFVGLD